MTTRTAVDVVGGTAKGRALGAALLRHDRTDIAALASGRDGRAGTLGLAVSEPQGLEQTATGRFGLAERRA